MYTYKHKQTPTYVAVCLMQKEQEGRCPASPTRAPSEGKFRVQASTCLCNTKVQPQ